MLRPAIAGCWAVIELLSKLCLYDLTVEGGGRSVFLVRETRDTERETMNIYAYELIRESGEPVRSVIEAESVEVALFRLRRANPGRDIRIV